jgi:hypothetical protein
MKWYSILLKDKEGIYCVIASVFLGGLYGPLQKINKVIALKEGCGCL